MGSRSISSHCSGLLPSLWPLLPSPTPAWVGMELKAGLPRPRAHLCDLGCVLLAGHCWALAWGACCVRDPLIPRYALAVQGLPGLLTGRRSHQASHLPPQQVPPCPLRQRLGQGTSRLCSARQMGTGFLVDSPSGLTREGLCSAHEQEDAVPPPHPGAPHLVSVAVRPGLGCSPTHGQAASVAAPAGGHVSRSWLIWGTKCFNSGIFTMYFRTTQTMLLI